MALEWLNWCDHELRQQALDQLTHEDLEAHDMMARAYSDHPHPSQRHYIQHVGNGSEYHPRGTNFTVGGYCQDTNTIYEFYGCFWRGCPKCYPVQDEVHLRYCDRTMEDVYRKTQQKRESLLGRYHLKEMWEYEWTRLKQSRPDIQAYVDSLQFVEPLNPRDAFCGGRTNAIKPYHHVTHGQKIDYIDYTSLYPWVNKTCVFPKGHPQFILQPGHTNIDDYFGVVQCQVLHPRELYHPVLPYRHAGKLTFPLCAACVQDEMQKLPLKRSYQCAHSDHERVLAGTWCTSELQ